MANGVNKKISDLAGKAGDMITQAKVKAAVEMLKHTGADDLAKMFNKLDKNELAKVVGKADKKDILKKLDEIDDKKLKEYNLDKAALKEKINGIDLNEVQKMLGDKGPEIIAKIKDIIK